ncbi:MAG TPA: Lsr2 family protein [Intrasporangium sp.]|uniref:histone-like nucleoid-structuring protein Lsr2 n=1 Tax=Intrasporangium sp. TaxID=1925024 RepID=UPI002D78D8B4|nr:Lsr2 family protein [Intrasporangium sp.]HET7396998.1 Lsr2 family protein [Intrasporangium sp.]
MAQQKIVTLIDDLDGTEASEPVSFAIDGTNYEIDLSERNAAALREALRRYTTAARPAGTRGHTGRKRVTIPSAGHSRNAEIRAWAHSNGHAVPARGRIPQRVVAAFDASY